MALQRGGLGDELNSPDERLALCVPYLCCSLIYYHHTPKPSSHSFKNLAIRSVGLKFFLAAILIIIYSASIIFYVDLHDSPKWFRHLPAREQYHDKSLLSS